MTEAATITRTAGVYLVVACGDVRSDDVAYLAGQMIVVDRGPTQVPIDRLPRPTLGPSQ